MDRQEKRKNEGIENGNDDDVSENSDVEDKVSWINIYPFIVPYYLHISTHHEEVTVKKKLQTNTPSVLLL